MPTDHPCRVSSTGTNVARLSDVIVRRTTMRYSSVSGFAYGRRTANPPPDPEPNDRACGARGRTAREQREAGQRQQRRPGEPEGVDERREQERRERVPEGAAGDVNRHGQPAPAPAEPVHEGRGRRVERRAAKAAGDKHRPEHHAATRRPDEAQDGDRDDRAGHHQQPRAATGPRGARTPTARRTPTAGTAWPACRRPPATARGGESAPAAAARRCCCRRRRRSARRRGGTPPDRSPAARPPMPASFPAARAPAPSPGRR